MSPLSKENCERLDRICQNKIRRPTPLSNDNSFTVLLGQGHGNQGCLQSDAICSLIILKQCSPIPKPVLTV